MMKKTGFSNHFKSAALAMAMLACTALSACSSGNASSGSTSATASTIAAQTTQATETTAAKAAETTAAPETTTAGTTASTDSPATLTLFAAASMTETLTEISELYHAEHPNTEIIFNFDSSGTLKTQIEEGAVCDIFISAAEKQMNQLDVTSSEDINPKHLDFVDTDTRFNLVENKVVLAIPDGNPADITSWNDIGTDKCRMIALGNEDVPVGSYSIEILESLKILDSLTSSNKITYGSNVKEVTTQVKEAAVDCGIIYATDAYSAGLSAVDTATADMCRQVIYPAAVLKGSAYKEDAAAFLEFLKTPQAVEIFESVGFSMAE